MNLSMISMILTNILIAYVYCCIYRRYTESGKVFNWQDYLIIMIFAVVVAFNGLYNYLFLRTLVSVVLTLLLFKIVFRDKIGVVLSNGLTIYFLSLIVDLLVGFFISIFVNDITMLNSMPLIKFGYSIIYALFLYLLSKIIFVQNAFKKIILLINNKKKVFIYIFVIISLISIMYCIYSLNFLDKKYYITLCIIVILTFIFNYIFYKNTVNNKTLEINNKYLQSNVNSYAKSVEDYRLLKHNLVNDLLLVKCTEVDNKNDVIDQIITKYNKDTEWINDLKNIPTGIQGVIYVKMQMAEKVGVKIFVENKILLDKVNINSKKYYNVCEILQIVLDNSIEAAKDTIEKLIYIYFDGNDKNYTIEVINTFSNDIDLEKIGDKNYSTKNRNSGLGLNYISRLNKEIKIKKSITRNLFNTCLIIKK